MKAFIILLLLMASQSLLAQETPGDSTTIYRIETSDGNEYIGTILSRSTEQIQLKTTRLGIITLRTVDVVRIEVILKERIKNDVLWFDNVQATRYFFMPNGYGLKKGEAYYQNVWVVFNQVSVGITDNFSLGLGMIPTFLFGGGGGIPIWLTPKLSIPLVDDRVNVGAGVFYATLLGGGEGNGVGIGYGLSTFGNKDKNFTFGLGYGFADGQLANAPTLSFSTMIRTGQRGYFLSENYFISVPGETVALISIGGRRIIKRAGLDFGLFAPIVQGQNFFFAAPWLGLTFKLDKKKV